jgi:hypothetical protein
MSFHVVSTLLSASADRFPDTHAMLVAESLGLSDPSRSRLFQHLNQLRRVLLADHVNIYPAKDLFSDLEVLPKHTLITLALAYGLAVPDHANCTTLGNSVATHIGMGLCTLREFAFITIACSSTIAQADTLIAPGTVDDPATRLQLYIMRQIAPVLTSRALRSLLDMHGVKYAPTDKTSKLHRHLLSFLHCLDRGKSADMDITSLGSERIARRQLIFNLAHLVLTSYQKETANGGEDDRDVHGPMLGAWIGDLMRCAVVMQVEDRSRSESKGYNVYDWVR